MPRIFVRVEYIQANVAFFGHHHFRTHWSLKQQGQTSNPSPTSEIFPRSKKMSNSLISSRKSSATKHTLKLLPLNCHLTKGWNVIPHFLEWHFAKSNPKCQVNSLNDLALGLLQGRWGSLPQTLLSIGEALSFGMIGQVDLAGSDLETTI